MKATLTRIPGIDLGPTSHGDCLIEGSSLFLVRGDDLIAVAPRDGRHSWTSLQNRPAPDYYRVPRRLKKSGRRLWARKGFVAFVFDTATGVRVQGYDSRSGRVEWHTDFDTPPPLPWTEKEPAWPDAETEELSAFLADAAELVLVVHRTSRRAMLWPEHPMPPPNSRLELTGIDWETGAIRWQVTLDGVEIPLLEKQRLELLFRVPGGIAWVDPLSGKVTTLPSDRKELGWPKRIGSHVCVPWRGRGKVGVDRWTESQGPLTSDWIRRGVKTARLVRLGARSVLHVNEQHLSVLTPDFRAPWEVRARTYVYDMAILDEELLMVGTTGAYGAAHAFRLEDGSLLASLPGATWSVSTLGRRSAVAVCRRSGLEVWEPKTGAPPEVVHDYPPALLVGPLGEGVIAVCSEPDSAVVLVE